MPTQNERSNHNNGRKEDALWKRFCDENHGVYAIGQYDAQDSVTIVYQRYFIIFDRYIRYQVVGASSFTSKFTRVRMECKTPGDLRFEISRQGFMESLGKLFGSQDIQVGDKDFDRKFLIKGSDVEMIRKLFADVKMQDLLHRQHDIQLHLLDMSGIFDEPIGTGNAMLYYISETQVTDIVQLDELLKLYKRLCDGLSSLQAILPLG
jgi:hypothetical protein